MSYLEGPVSGHPVITKKGEDWDEMFTRLFSYLHEVSEHGYRLIQTVAAEGRHPGGSEMSSVKCGVVGRGGGGFDNLPKCT